MSKQTESLITVATLGKAVGIAGALRLFLQSDFPEQFVPGATFISKRFGELRVKLMDFNRMLITFKGYETRENARKLTNDTLFSTIEKSQEVAELYEDEYLWIDIIGCTLYEQECCLGQVKEVDRLPIADYLRIETDEQLVAQGLPKQFLLPYQEPFIVNVEIDNQRINVCGAKDILEAS